MPESVYRQRNPQNSPYYQCVEDHFETFERVYDERFERRYGFFRPYVKGVIYVRTKDIKLVPIGNSRGIRIPKTLIQKFGMGFPYHSPKE